jgi:hypothetical protein
VATLMTRGQILSGINTKTLTQSKDLKSRTARQERRTNRKIKAECWNNHFDQIFKKI